MPHIPRAICAQCNREMRPVKNAETLEAMVTNPDEPPRPYYKLSADRWGCDQCGIEVYVGMPLQVMAHHFDEKYERIEAVRQFTFR